MKLTFILLTAAFLNVSGKGLSQNVSFSGKNVPLEKLFAEIKRQTGYGVTYSSKVIANAKPISINVEKISLNEFLDKILMGQGIKYTIEDRTILLSRKPAIDRSPDQRSFPSNGTFDLLDITGNLIDVKGKVVNEEGEPVVATITVKGTKQTTSTDENGYFTLNGVDENATLVFTSINMETFQIALQGKTELLISLKTKVVALSNVIVNKGYYSVRQRENTGGVSIVRGTDIQKQPSTDPIKALQGLSPGLFIQQSSGYAGGQFNKIIVRGQNSIVGGREPLVIVDGVPLPTSSISANTNVFGAAGALSIYNGLNPDNIESIEVLKDADATAIYGAQGANGIILINTKKGKVGKTDFKVNFYSGISQVSRYADLMNRKQYLQMRREAFINDGITPTAANAPDLLKWDTTRYTNWQKELIGGNATNTNLNASISGGNVNTQFFVSGAYNKQTTVVSNDFYDQVVSGHFNVNHKSQNEKLRMLLNTDYSSNRNFMPMSDITTRVIFTAPNAPELYLSNGDLNWSNSTWSNPISLLKQTSDATTNNFISSINLSYELLKGLSIKSTFGYHDLRISAFNLSPLAATDPAFANNSSRGVSYGTSNSRGWIVEPQMSYEIKKNKHAVDVLAGMTFQDTKRNDLKISANGFTNDALMKNISLAATKNVDAQDFFEYKKNKVYARIGYNYDEKYIVNLTGSREGSSRFGPNKQFGNFGAVGVAYLFSNEDFIKKAIPFLSFGKIRVSYGTTGNDQVGDYKYLSTYRGSGMTYQGLPVLTSNGLTDPYFSWETVKKLEAGLELSFLNDRINLNAAYFRNRTIDQLVGYVLPSTTGFTSITSNFDAVVQNSGFEVFLATENMSRKNFKWQSSFNLTIPRNKLVSFPNIESSSYSTLYAVGRPLTVRYVLHYTGMDPQTGLYTFQDLDNNGSIAYPNDYGFFVEEVQKFYGGLQNKFSYKKFTLDFLFQFVKKNGRNYISSTGTPGGINANQTLNFLDRWQKPGDNAMFEKYTRLASTPAGQARSRLRSSDKIFGDASFIRLRNLSVSYDLPSNLIKGVKAFHFFVGGQNLFFITKYVGDPEVMDLNTMPTLRTIVVGCQLTL